MCSHKPPYCPVDLLQIRAIPQRLLVDTQTFSHGHMCASRQSFVPPSTDSTRNLFKQSLPSFNEMGLYNSHWMLTTLQSLEFVLTLSSDRWEISWESYGRKRVSKRVGVREGSFPMAVELCSELPANKILPVKENWTFWSISNLV